MSLKKRILNFAVIQHPVLEEGLADAALAQVEQACDELWGLGLQPENNRLSPAAKRWRNEFVVRDSDQPADRIGQLEAFLGRLAENIRRHQMPREVTRVLSRGQLIFSGVENHRVHWGITITLNGSAPPQVHEQSALPSAPRLVGPAFLAAVAQCATALHAALEPKPTVESSASLESPSPKRRGRRLAS